MNTLYLLLFSYVKSVFFSPLSPFLLYYPKIRMFLFFIHFNIVHQSSTKIPPPSFPLFPQPIFTFPLYAD